MISLAVPTERFETSKVEKFGFLVRSCAGRISAALGHRPDFDIIKKENAR